MEVSKHWGVFGDQSSEMPLNPRSMSALACTRQLRPTMWFA